MGTAVLLVVGGFPFPVLALGLMGNTRGIRQGEETSLLLLLLLSQAEPGSLGTPTGVGQEQLISSSGSPLAPRAASGGSGNSRQGKGCVTEHGREEGRWEFLFDLGLLKKSPAATPEV